MNIAKKIVSLVLMLLMVISAFVGCAGDKNEETPMSTVKTQVGEDGKRYDENGYIMSDLPIDELDYGGEIISIYATAQELIGTPIFNDLETKMDIVEESTFYADSKVKSDLNVKIEVTLEPNSEFYEVDKIVSDINTQIMSGSRDYDLVSVYLRKQGMLMCSGLLYDFNTIEGSYIDFDKPWWPDELTTNSQVGDALYYVGGDISNTYLYNVWGMFYNDTMRQELGIESLTDLAMSGNWTLEKFQQLTRNVRVDDESLKDEEGRYGYVCVRYDLDAFFFGSGLNVLQYNDNDNRVLLADSYFSEKAINLVDIMRDFLKEDDVYLENDGNYFTDQTRRDRPIFNQGRALFHTDVLTNAKVVTQLEKNFEFGVLPMPKYDENQTNYISTVRPGMNRVWSILTNVESDTALMLTAFLEDLGSESYRRVTPAVFEICMKFRYSKDEVQSQMFDLIRQNVMFDLGQSLSAPSSSYLYQIPAICMASDKSWKTRAAVSAKSLQGTVDDLFENLLNK